MRATCGLGAMVRGRGAPSRAAPPLPRRPAPSRSHLAELSGRLAAIAQAHALLRLPLAGANPELRNTLQDNRPHPRYAAAASGGAAPDPGRDLGGVRVRRSLRGRARSHPPPARLCRRFRRSELVRIRVPDLSFGPHELSVLLARSKSDQESTSRPDPCRKVPHGCCRRGHLRSQDVRNSVSKDGGSEGLPF
jgi:hypothetical protein